MRFKVFFFLSDFNNIIIFYFFVIFNFKTRNYFIIYSYLRIITRLIIFNFKRRIFTFSRIFKRLIFSIIISRRRFLKKNYFIIVKK